MDIHNLPKVFPIELKKLDKRNRCGIYLLFKGDDLVYVGKASDVVQRVCNQHTKNKDFDYVSFFPAPYQDLYEIEAELIVKYKPPYNQRIPPNRKYISTFFIKSRFEGRVRMLALYLLTMVNPVTTISGSKIYEVDKLNELYEKYKHLKVKRLKVNI